MARTEDRSLVSRSDKNSLTAYRHLVELQKQMVELVKQNERSKQACEALRQQIALEAAALAARPRWQHHLKGLGRNLIRNWEKRI